MNRWVGAWSSRTHVTPTPAGPGRSAPCRMVTPSAGVRSAAKLRKISGYRTKNICSARPHPKPRHHLRVQARVCEGPRLPERLHLPGTIQYTTVQCSTVHLLIDPILPQNQQCVVKPDPCDPSPCGPGAECSVTRQGENICYKHQKYL